MITKKCPRSLPAGAVLKTGGCRTDSTHAALHFDSDSKRVTGERLYWEAGLTMPNRWVAGYLTPTVKYRAVSYELDNDPILQDDAPSAGSLMASIDGGLVFERQTSLAGVSMTQTLEPRAFYLVLNLRGSIWPPRL